MSIQFMDPPRSFQMAPSHQYSHLSQPESVYMPPTQHFASHSPPIMSAAPPLPAHPSSVGQSEALRRPPLTSYLSTLNLRATTPSSLAQQPMQSFQTSSYLQSAQVSPPQQPLPPCSSILSQATSQSRFADPLPSTQESPAWTSQTAPPSGHMQNFRFSERPSDQPSAHEAVYAEYAGQQSELAKPRRRRWDAREDALLEDLVRQHGACQWGRLARYFPGRNGRQVRLRWVNHLEPNVFKGEWTREEEEYVLRKHRELGNRWAAIAEGLHGRTDNAVKNRFKVILRRLDKEEGSYRSSQL